MTNPYTSLPQSSFWKTGITEHGSGGALKDIWQPRFAISRDTRILTAGSCFAQHISRWLTANGYDWADTEPASEELTDNERRDGQYGVFSFRTGNIYTAALLRQWLEFALGARPPVLDLAEEDGRHFDLLRPAVPACGYESREGAREALERTLDAIRKGLKEADLFIFTLGLTESWIHRDGHVYPMCPGTLRGTFDPGTVRFVNQAYEDVRRDMADAIGLARTVNPDLKFLLTVSPVPLTATASGDHVLSATIYSKSVLRAVAGDLCRELSGVDYFPSYELISAFPARGRFYEANLRSVTAEGVAHVMSHFSEGIGAIARSPGNGDPLRPAAAQSAKAADEILCDEVGLESWAPGATDAADTSVCLIGDSHMGHLSLAFQRLGLPHAGGMIMNGKAWTSNELALDDEELWVPLENALARRRWQETLPFLQPAAKGPAGQKIIFTNIGQQTHRSVAFLSAWLQTEHNNKLTNPLFFQYFGKENHDKLILIKRIVNRGFRVVVISDPPTQHLAGYHDPQLWRIYENLSERAYVELGCEFFNARNYIDAIGFQDRFISEKFKQGVEYDWLHGSAAYYDEIAEELIRRYALR
ncbi:GSCFA domain-containing protein [Pannonibacter sp. Pt2-lr]|uniref:GSCFA domain-containing protein n=1 Tax=Pannonibacter anstelovis TaxID=3121537 RepID=A0ABU7ZTI1_9HYPH